MSNSKWDAFVSWLCNWIADALPEQIKRAVLYTLNDRASLKKPEEQRDFWSVTTEEMYNELRDT